MGILSIYDVRQVPEWEATALPGGSLFIFAAGRNVQVALYRDQDLTETLPNPVNADVSGWFTPVYLVDGLYRIQIEDRFGRIRFEMDAVEVHREAQLSVIRFESVRALLDDISLGYASEPPRQKVSVGQTLHVSDGGFNYLVVGEDAVEADLETLGGVRCQVLRGSRGYDFRAFGADPNGTESCSELFQTLAEIARIDILILPTGIYRFEGPVQAVVTAPFSVMGDGIGRTQIMLDHSGQGVILNGSGTPGEPASYIRGINIGELSISRIGYQAYNGPIGSKSLYVSKAVDSRIFNVEESGAIGFGIQFDDCINVSVTGCHVHDHFGGMAGPTGTDGIHFYRCQNYRAEGNWVHDVGDDAISSGSFETRTLSRQCRNGAYVANRIENCGGAGLKAYSYISGLEASGNTLKNIRQGGIYLTGDANDPQDMLIEDVNITGNHFIDCRGQGGEIAGAFRMRFWPTNPNHTGLMRRICFSQNHGSGCRSLVYQVVFSGTKTFQDLQITDNRFDSFVRPEGAVGNEVGIQIMQCHGVLNVSRNILTGVQGTPFHFDHNPQGTFSADWSGTRLILRDNVVKNYSLTTASGTAARGLWVRSGRPVLEIGGNTLVGQKRGEGIFANYGIQTADKIPPISVITRNVTDTYAPARFAPLCHGGWLGDGHKARTSMPSSGTHYAGARYPNSVPTSGQPIEWGCCSDGSFGSLSGITASMVAGSDIVTLTSVSGLFPGEILSVAGAVTKARVLEIFGNTLQLDQISAVTVSDAVITYVPPGFVVGPSWA